MRCLAALLALLIAVLPARAVELDRPAPPALPAAVAVPATLSVPTLSIQAPAVVTVAPALEPVRQAVAHETPGAVFAAPGTLDARAEPASEPVQAMPVIFGHSHLGHSHAHGADDDHEHHEPPPGGGPGGGGDDVVRALKRVLLLSGGLVAVELAGGLALGSVALKGDALHLTADWALNAMALGALTLAKRPGRAALARKAEPVFGLVSAAAIGLTAAEIAREALARFAHPSALAGGETAALALFGLAANAVATAFLYKHRDAGLSVRGVFLHSLTDAAGSLAVVASGLASWAFGWGWTDPAASAVIVLLIGRTALGLARDSYRALRSANPKT